MMVLSLLWMVLCLTDFRQAQKSIYRIFLGIAFLVAIFMTDEKTLDLSSNVEELQRIPAGVDGAGLLLDQIKNGAHDIPEKVIVFGKQYPVDREAVLRNSQFANSRLFVKDLMRELQSIDDGFDDDILTDTETRELLSFIFVFFSYFGSSITNKMMANQELGRMLFLLAQSQFLFEFAPDSVLGSLFFQDTSDFVGAHLLYISRTLTESRSSTDEGIFIHELAHLGTSLRHIVCAPDTMDTHEFYKSMQKIGVDSFVSLAATKFMKIIFNNTQYHDTKQELLKRIEEIEFTLDSEILNDIVTEKVDAPPVMCLIDEYNLLMDGAGKNTVGTVPHSVMINCSVCGLVTMETHHTDCKGRLNRDPDLVSHISFLHNDVPTEDIFVTMVDSDTEHAFLSVPAESKVSFVVKEKDVNVSLPIIYMNGRLLKPGEVVHFKRFTQRVHRRDVVFHEMSEDGFIKSWGLSLIEGEDGDDDVYETECPMGLDNTNELNKIDAYGEQNMLLTKGADKKAMEIRSRLFSKFQSASKTECDEKHTKVYARENDSALFGARAKRIVCAECGSQIVKRSVYYHDESDCRRSTKKDHYTK